jgi:outer membrane lipoprotein-sorting protein
MKKIVSLLLVLVVVLGCVGLAACGGDGGAVPENGDSQPINGGEEPSNGGEEPSNGGGESLEDIVGQGIGSVSYTMEITAPGTPTVAMKVWSEGNKVRSEMEQGEQRIVNITNYDTGKAYMYMPDMNMAYEIDLSQAPETDYGDVQDIPNYDYTVIGTETMDGKSCLVVEYSAGGATVKSWIWKEHGFPIRTEVTTSEGTTVTVFKDIDFGDIADSMFELPAGVQIMEF